MRIAIALPGLHLESRGAEVAFESLARALAADARDEVTLLGAGPPRVSEPYRYVQARPLAHRERFERWPKFPPMRSEFVYEELMWMPGLLRRYDPSDFDVTITCSYPFTNWLLRARRRRNRPAHVFVTENGNWPPSSRRLEYGLFACDGVVCTNPDYFERNRSEWLAALIPNGVDVARFSPGPSDRIAFDLPADARIVLMVSALSPNKRVLESIRAVARLDEAWLVVAGDGVLRGDVDELADALIPGRFRRLTLPADDMPKLYRSADVFLHSALYESFGNVYIEALACGLPVVAHDYSVTRWVIGEDGLLVDATDEVVVAAALDEALATGRRPHRIPATKTADRFDWLVIAKQYRQFFEEVLEHREGRT